MYTILYGLDADVNYFFSIKTTMALKINKIKKTLGIPNKRGDKTQNQLHVITSVNFNIIKTIVRVPKNPNGIISNSYSCLFK